MNTQMLLGCLLMTVQDAAALEEAELRQNDGSALEYFFYETIVYFIILLHFIVNFIMNVL